jgi:hypothetical protein
VGRGERCVEIAVKKETRDSITALPEDNGNFFASRYQTIPSKEELKKLIENESDR